MATANEGDSEYNQEKQNLKSRKNQEVCPVHKSKPKERSLLHKGKPVTIRRSHTQVRKVISTEDIFNDYANREPDSTDESVVRDVKEPIPNISNENKASENGSSSEDLPKNNLVFQKELKNGSDSVTALDSSKYPITDQNELKYGSDLVTASVISNELVNTSEIQTNDNVEKSKKTGAEMLIEKKNELTENVSVGKKEDNIESLIEEKQRKAEFPNLSSPNASDDTLFNEITENGEKFLKIDEQINIGDKIDQSMDKMSLSEKILAQISHVSSSPNYGSFNSDADAEWKHSTPMRSLKENQNIYKFAYDENVTDQSNSTSPSPIDPETQVPSSITNSEIIIHEANSDSDAGSEDVELIPHRYESESFLNASKHVYVNKLSLAVELLRTQENLPYDEQFKRVVNENGKDGQVNYGFVEDTSANFNEKNNSIAIITNQSQAKRHSTNGSLFPSDSFEIVESYETAKEAEESIVAKICKACSVS